MISNLSIDDIFSYSTLIQDISICILIPYILFGEYTRVSLGLLVLGILCKYIQMKCRNYKLPSETEWRTLGCEDIALVTGGARGLGREIVNGLLERKVKKVYILDISENDDQDERIIYKKCNLGDESSCIETVRCIVSELEKCQEHISVLVNNAGIRHSESLLNLSNRQIRNIFEINSFSQIWIIKEILNNHLKNVLFRNKNSQLFIVSVSSALGSLAPRNLSVYAASKAIIIQIHEALTREISEFPTVRLLLVTPGQLTTSMFTDVHPSKTFLAPLVNHVKLAYKIIDRVGTGEKGELCDPFYANFLPVIRLFPILIQDIFRRFSQMDEKIKEN